MQNIIVKDKLNLKTLLIKENSFFLTYLFFNM